MLIRLPINLDRFDTKEAQKSPMDFQRYLSNVMICVIAIQSRKNWQEYMAFL